MRKDVRFGLTIGGSLVAVLVIWLTLLDHGNSRKSELAVGPATMPSDSGQTANVTTDTPLTVDAGAKTDAAATQPVIADNSSNNSSSRDWTHLLDTGSAATLSVVQNGPTTAPALLLGEAPASDTATTQPAMAMAAAGSRTHKVAVGETFYTIAAAMYGDGKYFGRIVAANPNVNPNRLRVGTVLNIPDAKGEVTAPAIAAGDKTPARAEVDSATSYRVLPSDTLMAISRKLYGNGQTWEKIYDANRDAIGPNPARLKVGMVLRLPAAPVAN